MLNTIQKTDTIFFALGTLCKISIFHEQDAPAVHKAVKRVKELHRMLNAYDTRSEISLINSNAGKCFTQVSAETMALIRGTLAYSKLTDGLFDITSTPLSQLWKEAAKTKTLPAAEEIVQARKLVNYRDIVICANALMLNKPGQKIDLGAVAKGYAADEVKRILLENAVESAVINLGGTVTVIGGAHTVGIQNPFEKTGKAFACIPVSDASVVTSGIYEQSFRQNGKCYHHIANPKTGFPARTAFAGVSLIGENAQLLDTLCTILLLLPEQEALNLIKTQELMAVIVKQDGRLFISESLKNNFTVIGKES